MLPQRTGSGLWVTDQPQPPLGWAPKDQKGQPNLWPPRPVGSSAPPAQPAPCTHPGLELPTDEGPGVLPYGSCACCPQGPLPASAASGELPRSTPREGTRQLSSALEGLSCLSLISAISSFSEGGGFLEESERSAPARATGGGPAAEGGALQAHRLLRVPQGALRPYAATLGLCHPLGAFVSLLRDVTRSFYCCADGCINLYLMGRSAIGHGATAV